MFTLTVGSEALTLSSEGMHFIKDPHHAAELHSSVYTTFTIGIPNMRFHKINFENFQGFDHWGLPDCIHTSSKTTLRRNTLDNTVLLHSSPTQVKIIWDMNYPFGIKCKLKRAFADSKIHSKAEFFVNFDFSFYSSSSALQSLTTANSFSPSLLGFFCLIKWYLLFLPILI